MSVATAAGTTGADGWPLPSSWVVLSSSSSCSHATTPVDDAVAAFVPIPAPPGWPVRRPPTTSTTSPSPTTPTPTTNNRRRRSTHPSPRPMGTLEDNHNQGPGLNCRRPLMHTLTAATASINHRPVHRLLETGRRRRRARIKTASQTDRKNGRKDLYWTTVAFQRTVLWALEVDGDDDSPCVGPYCLVSRDINDDYVSTTIPVSALHTDDARSDDLIMRCITRYYNYEPTQLVISASLGPTDAKILAWSRGGEFVRMRWPERSCSSSM